MGSAATRGKRESRGGWRRITPRPATSRREALERVGAMQRLDDAEVDPEGGTRLLEPAHGAEKGEGDGDGDGGEMAGQVVVLIHGLCNGPRQFLPLGERLAARGATVLLPRLPRHGLRDRMTSELSHMGIEEVVATASEAVDIAMGLGERVTVAGLSLGGVLAGWAGQYRPVARAVLIAPAIGAPRMPLSVSRVLFAALRRLPDRFIWWDRELRERLPGPAYAYPRFSTRALARLQQLGFALLDDARTTAPMADEVWLVTNASDRAVDNTASALLAARWRAAGARAVHEHELPLGLDVAHDVIDPQQPYARVEEVYPILERIIADDRPQSAAPAR